MPPAEETEAKIFGLAIYRFEIFLSCIPATLLILLAWFVLPLSPFWAGGRKIAASDLAGMAGRGDEEEFGASEGGGKNKRDVKDSPLPPGLPSPGGAVEETHSLRAHKSKDADQRALEKARMAILVLSIGNQFTMM